MKDVLVLVMSGLVLASCGSSEESSRAGDTVATYIGALVARDYAVACKLLADAPPHCSRPSILTRQRVRAWLPRLRDRPDWKTEVDGADATITSRAGRWQLVRNGEAWKIRVAPVVPFVRSPGPRADTAASFGQALQQALDAGAKRAAGFDQAERALPIRLPPLRVHQYVLDPDRDEVVARVPASDFFCSLGPARQRHAVVDAFYREAAALFRYYAVPDLRLVVAATGQTFDRIEPWALGRRGEVRLTAAGRAHGAC